jgi:hypothetical protein
MLKRVVETFEHDQRDGRGLIGVHRRLASGEDDFNMQAGCRHG